MRIDKKIYYLGKIYLSPKITQDIKFEAKTNTDARPKICFEPTVGPKLQQGQI